MTKHATDLNIGERAIDNAPHLTLRNGRSCIPQHYLQYSHSRESVEALMSDVEFCNNYPIFVCEDAGGIYLQIGIVGFDNYKAAKKQPGPKIVFGRKWRVEPNLPSSEIIQTAFLAIKKAREHELRELFTFNFGGKISTPFNNHHDLPLMARNSDILSISPAQDVSHEAALSSIKFDSGRFKLEDYETLRNGLHAVSLSYAPRSSGKHTEFSQTPIVLIVKDLSSNTLSHALITEMIAISDRFVDRNFKFKGFARFSPDVDASSISALSVELRQNPETLIAEKPAKSFTKTFAAERYDTDMTRIPQLTKSSYSQKLHGRLKTLGLANFDMLQAAQTDI